jgi:hypothetical protein
VSSLSGALAVPTRERRFEWTELRLESGREAREVEFFSGRGPDSGSAVLWEGSGTSSMPAAFVASCSMPMGSFSVGGAESRARLRRSRGSPMLVRPLSPPVLRSTIREEGATLWRLRRCSGRVRSGYSSRPSVLREPSASCGWMTGRLGRAKARGEELTGFHRREAGARGSEGVRKLKPKMRFVKLQRAGGRGDSGGAVGRGGDDRAA